MVNIKQIACAASTYSKEPDVVVLLGDGSLFVFVPTEGWKKLPPLPVAEGKE